MIIRSPQRKSPEDCLLLPSEISISAHVTAAGPLTSTTPPLSPPNPSCSHFNSFLAKVFNHAGKRLYCAAVVASFLQFHFYLSNHTRVPVENIHVVVIIPLPLGAEDRMMEASSCPPSG